MWGGPFRLACQPSLHAACAAGCDPPFPGPNKVSRAFACPGESDDVFGKGFLSPVARRVFPVRTLSTVQLAPLGCLSPPTSTSVRPTRASLSNQLRRTCSPCDLDAVTQHSSKHPHLNPVAIPHGGGTGGFDESPLGGDSLHQRIQQTPQALPSLEQYSTRSCCSSSSRCV